MAGFDWKGMLGKVAPWLAATLGGPGAGLAVDALCRATGIEPSLDNARKAAQMAAAGSLTGDQFIALQAAEQGHMERMQEMGFKQLVDLEQIGYQDRASARDREVKTGDSWTPRILAAVVVGGFLWCLYYVLSGKVAGLKDPSVSAMIGSLIGYASAKADTVVGYYFGSSAGSDRKTDILGGQK
jgi:hypothetical protein